MPDKQPSDKNSSRKASSSKGVDKSVGISGAVDVDADLIEKNEEKPDPTRYGDWEKNGRCIDF